MWNARLDASCRIRPDFSWECQSHVTLVEVDKNCHRTYAMENERLLCLRNHLKKNVLVIRLNDPIKWQVETFDRLRQILQLGISTNATVSIHSATPTSSSTECKFVDIYVVYVDQNSLLWFKLEDLIQTDPSSSDCVSQSA